VAVQSTNGAVRSFWLQTLVSTAETRAPADGSRQRHSQAGATVCLCERSVYLAVGAIHKKEAARGNAVDCQTSVTVEKQLDASVKLSEMLG
jgi:hypothetical protein